MTIAADIRVFEVLGIILALIVLDFLVGVVKSFMPPVTFSIQKFPGQLASFVLPYFAPLFLLAVVQLFSPLLNIAGVVGTATTTFYVAAAAVGLKALQDILLKIGVGFTPAPQPAPKPVAAPPPAGP
jgi:phage-related holin